MSNYVQSAAALTVVSGAVSPLWKVVANDCKGRQRKLSLPAQYCFSDHLLEGRH